MQNTSTTQYEKTRRYERKPYAETIDYSMSVPEARDRKWLNLKARAVNISEAGLCIQTDFALSPGDMLWFNSGLKEKAGFVRWALKSDSGYKAGIELDGKHIKTLDEATEIFNKRLEEIEKKCLDTTDQNPDKVLEETRNAIDDMCEACKTFEEDVKDKDVIRDAQTRFRQKTDYILSKGYCINRARTWPQGYQGDYKMLEAIYRNTPLSEGIGYYLDVCTLNAPLAVGVRNRLSTLVEILKGELTEREKPKVLNIACGSCREVFELASEIEKSGARVTCIDLDDDALAFAANRLSYTNISPVTSNQVKLRKYNAVRMFDHEMNMSEFGMQDIIYSVGLFDYLPTDFLVNLLGALYKMVKPGGKLIASFKDAGNYRHQVYHWMSDWDGFLQRNEEDFRNILFNANIPSASITETREDSGIIVFYVITK
jgi:extracellular factor (EF) 3-hydroxypalmitic acid methyl ester biosynthesis protein